MLDILGKFFVITFFTGVLFSIMPNLTYNYVKKLLMYHDYDSENLFEDLKKRVPKVVRTYLALGISLGTIFFFIPTIMPFSQNIIPDTFSEKTIFAYVVSFSLIIILRVSILLNKSNLLVFFFENEKKLGYLEKVKKKWGYNQKLKNNIESYLFSLFMTTLIIILISFLYYGIFYPEKISAGTEISLSWINFFIYLGYLFLIFLILVVVTIVTEVLLSFVGVNYGCKIKHPSIKKNKSVNVSSP